MNEVVSKECFQVFKYDMQMRCGLRSANRNGGFRIFLVSKIPQRIETGKAFSRDTWKTLEAHLEAIRSICRLS